jgi:hypothetical protein
MSKNQEVLALLSRLGDQSVRGLSHGMMMEVVVVVVAVMVRADGLCFPMTSAEPQTYLPVTKVRVGVTIVPDECTRLGLDMAAISALTVLQGSAGRASSNACEQLQGEQDTNKCKQHQSATQCMDDIAGTIRRMLSSDMGTCVTHVKQTMTFVICNLASQVHMYRLSYMPRHVTHLLEDWHHHGLPGVISQGEAAVPRRGVWRSDEEAMLCCETQTRLRVCVCVWGGRGCTGVGEGKAGVCV